MSTPESATWVSLILPVVTCGFFFVPLVWQPIDSVHFWLLLCSTIWAWGWVEKRYKAYRRAGGRL